MLKAITLWEPYASLMAIGAKINETRGVRTAHRGEIAIHAAMKEDGTPEELVPDIIRAFQSRNMLPDPNSLGCIVAVVDLWDVQPAVKFYCEPATTDPFCITAEEFKFGNYSPGRFVYRTRNLRRLATPVRCRGAQCIGWGVPPNIEAKVRAQLV